MAKSVGKVSQIIGPRYAIDNSKVKVELGWKPKTSFESGLNKTVRYYLEL